MCKILMVISSLIAGVGCSCDEDWSGVTCSYPTRTLPVRLLESFSSLPDDVSWSHINGGLITTRCGVIAVGTAMHMKGVSAACYDNL